MENNFITNNKNILERIDSYLKIEPYLDSETKEKVLKDLNITNIDVKTRGFGKIKEVEFEIIMLFSNKFKLIIPLGEELTILNNEKIPDYLTIDQEDKKYLIEIKNKSNDKRFKISDKYIQSQMDYAKKIDAKLLYAISIKGEWYLFDAKNLLMQKSEILNNPLQYSIFDSFFNLKTYAMNKGFWIMDVYDRSISEDEGIGLYDEELGWLKSFIFGYKQSVILNSDEQSNRIWKILNPFSVAFEILFAGLREKKKIVDQNGYMTITKSVMKEDIVMLPIINILEFMFIVNQYNYKTMLHFKSFLLDNKINNFELLREVEAEYDRLIEGGYPIKVVDINKIKIKEVNYVNAHL